MTDVSLPATGQTPPTVEPFMRVTINGHVHDLTPTEARNLAERLDDALREPLADVAAAIERGTGSGPEPAVFRSPAEYASPQPAE